jgi:DNA end-binding protein Ku
MVAIGKVVFTSREHIIALEPRGKGMLGVTLRYPYEVRNEEEYFDDIPEPKITKDMLDLATHIVATKTSVFDPKKFEDQYEDAVKELLKKKQHGEKIEVPKERKPANVVNLMEALRQSIAAEGGAAGKRAPARSVPQRGAKKKANKSSARQRKAG